MDLLFGAVGLILLLFSGDALVKGAVNLALRLGIPALIVSLTIVSVGTSAPELVISVDAVLEGAPGVAIGNVVGSNIANILLVLGIPALMTGIDTHLTDTRRSYVYMFAGSVWFVALCFWGPLVWWHGILLLVPLVAIIFDQIAQARAHKKVEEQEREDVEGADPSMSWGRIALFLGIGIVGLPVGASLFVDAAVNVATMLGVSETVIGLTLVAIGTSLPELATTVVAALRRHAEVALGNAIGSNLFNLLGIVGVASMFGGIPLDPTFLRFDLWIMLAATLALAPFVLLQINMSRMMGALLVTIYSGYVLVVLT